MVTEIYQFIVYTARIAGICAGVVLTWLAASIAFSGRSFDIRQAKPFGLALSLLVLMVFSTFALLWLHG